MANNIKIISILFFLMVNFLIPASARALSISVHVPEKYTDVKAGERFYFEVELKYPENPKRKDLRFIYEIKQGDKVISQAKFLKAVETQASFMDFIVIPENTKSGIHTINVKIQDYDNLSEEVSTTFFVKSTLDTSQLYFFILLGIVVFMAILVLDIFLFIGKRRRKKWIIF